MPLDLTKLPILGQKPREELGELWFYHTDYSVQVRAVKDDFKVYLRIRGQQVHWVITDRDPQGADYLVMTVQEPDGRYRPFDGRTLENLRRIVQRGSEVEKIVAEMAAKEAAKAKEDERRDQQIADGIAGDLKYAGRVITDSVASRERGEKNGSKGPLNPDP